MTEETAEIVREMDATRAQMARDIDQLQARVKQRLDVAQLVRDHPWPAIGAAVVLGALVGGSGADEKAAVATVAGAKAAASASKSAVSGVMEKLHSSDDDEPETLAAVESRKPGLGERLFDALGAMVARGLDGLVEDMRVASRDWGARMADQSRTRQAMTVATTTAVVAVAEPVAPASLPNEAASAADEVPVPREMLPTEVDARADAVEALGGGTHEPPLAPGAGDLGARWA